MRVGYFYFELIVTHLLLTAENYDAGLSDPYVKGQIGAFRFRTRIQRKTLCPKWLEEFKIPITSWESPNVLELQVHNKDIIFDDILGFVKTASLLFMCNDCCFAFSFYNKEKSIKLSRISFFLITCTPDQKNIELPTVLPIYDNKLRFEYELEALLVFLTMNTVHS